MTTFRSKITKAVLNYFFLKEGEEVHINELSRRIGVESGNLTRKLIELENEGILKSRRVGAQRFFSLNHDFALYKEYKNIVKKTIGIEPVLKDVVAKFPDIKKSIIFGSYAKDTMDQHSDIDVLVIGDHSVIELQKKIAGIQKQTNREINVISMASTEYSRKKKAKDQFIMNIESDKFITLK